MKSFLRSFVLASFFLSFAFGAQTGNRTGPSFTVLTGKPYAAVEETLHSRISADGETGARIMQLRKMYRDSQGRTRSENTFTCCPPGKPVSNAYIVDPVAGVMLSLNGNTATYIRPQFKPGPPRTLLLNKLPPEIARAAGLSPDADPQPPITQIDLGAKVIEGLAVEGKRTTISRNYAVGDTTTTETVSCEVWDSPDFEIVVEKTCSEGNGVNTIRLLKIDTSEPAPELFEAPSDDIIVNKVMDSGGRIIQ